MRLNSWLLPPFRANLLQLKAHNIQVTPAIRPSTVPVSLAEIGLTMPQPAVVIRLSEVPSRILHLFLAVGTLRRQLLSFIDCVVLECAGAVPLSRPSAGRLDSIYRISALSGVGPCDLCCDLLSIHMEAGNLTEICLGLRALGTYSLTYDPNYNHQNATTTTAARYLRDDGADIHVAGGRAGRCRAAK